jgi:hypothetical protein
MLPPTGTIQVRCPECELLQTVLCRRCQAKLKFSLEQPKDPVASALAEYPVSLAAKMLGMSERTLYRRKAATFGRGTPKITRLV